MFDRKFLFFAGYLFLIWGILDFLLKIKIYGSASFEFLWFCSVTLFILALGIILRSPMLLNSFFAIALLVQPFWIIDYVSFALFGVWFNGLSTYAFLPGYGILEFVSNIRHLLMLPLGFLAVFLLSKKNKNSYIFIPIFISVLLSLSVVFAPNGYNLNCVLEPCINSLELIPSSVYFVVFLFGTIVSSMLINYGINIILEKTANIRNSKRYKNFILTTFIVLFFFSIISIAAASLKYADVPKYTCGEGLSDSIVDIKCGYVSGPLGNLSVTYIIKNSEELDYICDFYIKTSPIDKEYTLIAERSFIRADSKYYAGKNIMDPGVDSVLNFKAVCREFDQEPVQS